MNYPSISKRRSPPIPTSSCPHPAPDSTESTSYWTKQTLHLEIAGPDGVQALDLHKPFARIGGHPLSDVLLTLPGIQKKQLYLHISDDQVFAVDFTECPTNGKTIELSSVTGQTLDCGSCKITPTIVQPPTSPIVMRSAGRDRPSRSDRASRLYILMPGRKPIKYPISRMFTTIGRSSNNKISIANDLVSKFQCIVFNSGDALWVVDLLSLNQTRLNGEAVDCAMVPVGGRLNIGSIEMVNPPSRHSAKIHMMAKLAPPQQPKNQSKKNGVKKGRLIDQDFAAPSLTKRVPGQAVVAQTAVQLKKLRRDPNAFDELIVRLTRLVNYQQEVFEVIRHEHQENCQMLEGAVMELKNQWRQLNDEKRKFAEENAKLDGLNLASITDTRNQQDSCNQQLTDENLPQSDAPLPAKKLADTTPSQTEKRHQQQKLQILHNTLRLGRGKRH